MSVIATCHCGGIRLSFPVLRADSLRRCDCSYCRRRSVIVATVKEDELVVENAETLSLYQFGTMTAEHYFCSRCGIYTHHRRRSNPREFGVNYGCIEGADVKRVVKWNDGVNHPSDRPGLTAAEAADLDD